MSLLKKGSGGGGNWVGEGAFHVGVAPPTLAHIDLNDVISPTCKRMRTLKKKSSPPNDRRSIDETTENWVM